MGIGGGAFYVPLFNALLGFGLKEATALSQAVITGGALASVPIAAIGRHPADPAKPLLDYDMALMLTPVILFGVSVGARPGGPIPLISAPSLCVKIYDSGSRR